MTYPLAVSNIQKILKPIWTETLLNVERSTKGGFSDPSGHPHLIVYWQMHRSVWMQSFSVTTVNEQRRFTTSGFSTNHRLPRSFSSFSHPVTMGKSFQSYFRQHKSSSGGTGRVSRSCEQLARLVSHQLTPWLPSPLTRWSFITFERPKERHFLPYFLSNVRSAGLVSLLCSLCSI